MSRSIFTTLSSRVRGDRVVCEQSAVGPTRYGRVAVAGVLLMATLLAGCAAGAPSADESSAQAVERTRDVAADGGADARQIAVFDDGEVTFAEYEGAFGDFQTCVGGVGGGVLKASLATVDGTKRFDYVIQAPDGDQAAFEEHLDDCYSKWFQWVDMYWQSDNPDAIAFRERRGKALRPALVRCLADAGVVVSGDATYEELVGKVNQLMVAGGATAPTVSTRSATKRGTDERTPARRPARRDGHRQATPG